MRVTYLTTDDVNRDLALQFAGETGVALQLPSAGEAAPAGPLDAVAYDWDHLHSGCRKKILAELLSGRTCGLAALHSYNLTDEQTLALRKNGVLVSRRLERRLFRLLGQSALVFRDAVFTSFHPEHSVALETSFAR